MATNKKISFAPAPLAPRPLRLRIDTQAEDVRVEIVPLIDVIFCILTFFILSAVGFSRQQAISIDLPKANTGTPQERELLVVTLNDMGQVFVGGQPVITKQQFFEKLQAYTKQNPQGLMALYASPSSSYNEVVQVLDLLRQVGGDRVALATLPGGAEQTPGATPSLPPATAVPGVPPYPGANPYYPYNPTQPQLPLNPEQPLPGLPGTNPYIPQPLPGQPGVNPGNLGVPSPGTSVTPNLNAAPGQNNPGNLAVPSPGTSVAPNPNAAPRR